MGSPHHYFPDDYYPLLNKDYLEALEELHMYNTKAALCQFSKKYLIPPNGWIRKIEAASSGKAKEYAKLALNDFCYSIPALKRFEIKLVSDNLNCCFASYKPIDPKFKFTYPHTNIRQEFMEYEKTSPSFLPTKLSKTVDKMEALYIKISAAYQNLEMWLNCLKEYGEDDFVWQNVEYRISQELCNKDLWHLYFRYLEDHNPEGLPRVLSAYCRFWVDDEDMNQKFKEAAEKFPNWKDYFPFKEKIVEKVDARKRLNFNIISKPPLKKARFDMSNPPQRQRLALPETMIFSIFKQSDPNLLSKLQKSSKYCYGRIPNPICHRAWITEGYKFHTGCHKDTLSMELKKPNLTTIISNLHIGNRLIYTLHENLALSKMIKTTIYKCDAKYIRITNQELTKTEFEFLINPERVEELKLTDCSIKTENDNLMAIEEILTMVPNIRSFETNLIQISSSTALANIKLSKKLLNFQLSHQREVVDFDCLEDFILENAGPHAYFFIQFWVHDAAYGQRGREFHDRIKHKFQNWILRDDQPKFFSNLRF